MTGRPAPDARPVTTEATGDVAAVTAEWCPACKAYTLLAGATVLLTRNGATVVGYWAWCETCDMEEAPPRV